MSLDPSLFSVQRAVRAGNGRRLKVAALAGALRAGLLRRMCRGRALNLGRIRTSRRRWKNEPTAQAPTTRKQRSRRHGRKRSKTTSEPCCHLAPFRTVLHFHQNPQTRDIIGLWRNGPLATPCDTMLPSFPRNVAVIPAKAGIQAVDALTVIPAKAGIQNSCDAPVKHLDSRHRGNGRPVNDTCIGTLGLLHQETGADTSPPSVAGVRPSLDRRDRSSGRSPEMNRDPATSVTASQLFTVVWDHDLIG